MSISLCIFAPSSIISPPPFSMSSAHIKHIDPLYYRQVHITHQVYVEQSILPASPTSNQPHQSRKSQCPASINQSITFLPLSHSSPPLPLLIADTNTPSTPNSTHKTLRITITVPIHAKIKARLARTLPRDRINHTQIQPRDSRQIHT
jgi:hypothetical protein